MHYHNRYSTQGPLYSQCFVFTAYIYYIMLAMLPIAQCKTIAGANVIKASMIVDGVHLYLHRVRQCLLWQFDTQTTLENLP